MFNQGLIWGFSKTFTRINLYYKEKRCHQQCWRHIDGDNYLKNKFRFYCNFCFRKITQFQLLHRRIKPKHILLNTICLEVICQFIDFLEVFLNIFQTNIPSVHRLVYRTSLSQVSRVGWTGCLMFTTEPAKKWYPFTHIYTIGL